MLAGPGVVCAAKVAFGLPSTRSLTYGRQVTRVGPVPAWVLPSPSGAGRRYWSIEPWQALADALG